MKLSPQPLIKLCTRIPNWHQVIIGQLFIHVVTIYGTKVEVVLGAWTKYGQATLNIDLR